MVLSVLYPWKTEVFSGGPVRSGTGCCRHQVGPDRHTLSRESPFRRRAPRNPRSECKDLRRLQHSNHSNVLHQLASFHSGFGGLYCPVERRLDTMIEGFNRLLASDVPWAGHFQNDAMFDTSAAVPKAIHWTVAKDNTNEVRGQLQVPLDVLDSHGLKVELDETSRTLTIRAAHSSDSHGPRSAGSCYSMWEISQRLDDSIELDRLEVCFDPEVNALQLRAPLKTTTQAVRSSSTEDQTEELKDSAHESEDSATCSETSRSRSGTPALSKGGEEVTEGPTIIPICRRPVEIEDVGPDEESDRISIAASE